MKINLLSVCILILTACSSPRTDFVPVQEGGSEDAAAMDNGDLFDGGFSGGGAGQDGSAQAGSGQGGVGQDGSAQDGPMTVEATTCTKAGECKSGFCVGGFCCNTACGGSCQSCSLPGKTGTCSPLSAGQACGEKSCSAGVEMASTCDGVGNCAAITPRGCAPYVCGANACTAMCGNNAECSGDSICIMRKCEGRKPTVSSVSPPQGFVASDSVFTLTFTKKMDPASTVAAVSFTPGLSFDATWDATGTILTLKPKAPLSPLPSDESGSLVLLISNGAKDVTGLALDSTLPITFNYKRLHKYEAQLCSLIDKASVTAGFMGGRVSADVMSVGTSGTNVPGRIIDSRAFATFSCGGIKLQQAQEVLGARLVFKVKTAGSPLSPDILIKVIPVQNEYTSTSYSVEPISSGFSLNANMPSTWSVDVKAIAKLPEIKSGLYVTFRAETATSPTISGFDGYDLLSLGDPALLLDFVAP